MTIHGEKDVRNFAALSDTSSWRHTNHFWLIKTEFMKNSTILLIGKFDKINLSKELIWPVYKKGGEGGGVLL